ncbi:MAG TPA: FAD-dependent oxidoreductase [bacterium]|nr:FAD-dependent oxidoreductase [bacterium]
MAYVIIGNSVSAVACIEAVRSRDKKTPITVIGDEPYYAYSRPMIPEYLARIESADRLTYRPKSFYEENGVETILGTRVIEIEPGKKDVVLENKERISYSKLLVSTGAKSFVPPIKGGGVSGVFNYIKWDDVKAIEAYLKENDVRRVVTVGAGLIGLKAAEIFAYMGYDSTVVELADRVLASVLDKAGSEIYREKAHRCGVDVKCGTTVSEILSENGKVSGVILKDGSKIECQMLVIAIGVVPNTVLAVNAKLKVNRGVLVNARMETGLADVYAAGDVCECRNLLTGDTQAMPIWPKAYKEGYIAGIQMSGGKDEFDGIIPMNSIEFCHLPFITAGFTNLKDESGFEIMVKEDRKNDFYKKLILKDGVLVGAILVGDAVNRAGIYTGLVARKANVSGSRKYLLRDDFGFVYLDRKYRDMMFTENPK